MGGDALKTCVRGCQGPNVPCCRECDPEYHEWKEIELYHESQRWGYVMTKYEQKRYHDLAKKYLK